MVQSSHRRLPGLHFITIAVRNYDGLGDEKVTDRFLKGELECTNGNRLCDLDYADDVVMCETSEIGMQQLTEVVERILESVGLRVNAEKCNVR